MSTGTHFVHPNGRNGVQTADHWGRREFVKGIAALAGAAGLSAYDMRSAAAESEPETRKIRIVHSPALCFAPQYIADALLKAEGFADVEYIEAKDRPALPMVAAGEGDFTIDAVRSAIVEVERGATITVLSGVHLGCYELFASQRVHRIRDLKGRRVAVYAMGSDSQIFLASMAAYVGLDSAHDINWVVQPAADSMRDLQQGKV